MLSKVFGDGQLLLVSSNI